LVAEDITSRFLNVISLFNGTLPIVALQMQAMKVADYTTLVFTKVMDELSRGLEEEDEPETAPADRSYWEKRGSKSTMQLSDELFAIAREIDSSLELQYNRHYIGLFKAGQPFNFIVFKPRKSAVNLEIKMPRSDAVDKKIEEAGIDVLPYTKWGRYRLSLEVEDVAKHRDLLKQLMQTAYQLRAA
jgi:predicted transport protein